VLFGLRGAASRGQGSCQEDRFGKSHLHSHRGNVTQSTIDV
jgi:hypothetical protein